MHLKLQITYSKLVNSKTILLPFPSVKKPKILDPNLLDRLGSSGIPSFICFSPRALPFSPRVFYRTFLVSVKKGLLYKQYGVTDQFNVFLFIF